MQKKVAPDLHLRAVGYAKTCLEAAQKLEKSPSSDQFSAVTNSIFTVFQRWKDPEKIAESKESLNMITCAVEIVVKCACERRIAGLALARCEKLDQFLTQGRQLYKDADASLAE